MSVMERCSARVYIEFHVIMNRAHTTEFAGVPGRYRHQPSRSTWPCLTAGRVGHAKKTTGDRLVRDPARAGTHVLYIMYTNSRAVGATTKKKRLNFNPSTNIRSSVVARD